MSQIALGDITHGLRLTGGCDQLLSRCFEEIDESEFVAPTSDSL